MKKIGAFLFKDIGWKLMSLILALVLWVLVMTIIDPPGTKRIDVRLAVENKDRIINNGFVLLNESTLVNRTISITASGKTSKLNELNAGNIVAYVDLEPTELTYDNKLNVLQPVSVYTDFKMPGFSDIQLTPAPRTVNIRVDKTVREVWPVEYDIVKPADLSYVMMDPLLFPDSVVVTGPQSVVGIINSVRVTADISGADGDATLRTPVRIYDGNHDDITPQLSLSAEEIIMNIPVYVRGTVQLTAEVTGTPTADHYYTTHSVNMDAVEVFGPREKVEALTALELPPVHIDDATENVTVHYDLFQLLAGTGLLVYGDARDVVVTANIERFISRVIHLPFSDITIMNLDPDIEFEGIPEYISIRVKGRRETIDGLSAANFRESLDLGGLTEGVNEIPIIITMPPGVFFDGPEPVMSILIGDQDIPEIEVEYIEPERTAEPEPDRDEIE